MESVTSLITHPLSLAVYIVFLAFAFAAKRRSRRFFYLAAILSLTALVGGLFLSWREINNNQRRATSTTGASKTDLTPLVEQKPDSKSSTSQTSKGNQSPNVSGVQGDM